MKLSIRLSINGGLYELHVEPQRTLLEVLREDLQLTGTKCGCNVGDCGACTVLMDGKPVNSCLVLALRAQGKDIQTIEGLAAQGSAPHQLHPLQESFLKNGASQCGFCTPGMIMAGTALLDENPQPTETEVRSAISGNICRCTGYKKIVEAIKDCGPKAEG